MTKHCSFCGKPEHQLQHLISSTAAPTPVYICDKCLEVSMAILLAHKNGLEVGK